MFLLFFSNHPLEGRYTVKPNEIKTDADEKRIYGTDPIFIFDPNDKRNAPTKLTSANAINIWNKVPVYIREIFIEAFEKERLMGNKPRILESVWLKTLVRWRSDYVKCNCGEENLVGDGGVFTCKCGIARRVPVRLQFRRDAIPLYPASKLYAIQTILENEDFHTVTGEVIRNPKDPKVLGIKNLSNATWAITGSDGTTTPKKPSEVTRIIEGVIIDFGRDHKATIISNK